MFGVVGLLLPNSCFYGYFERVPPPYKLEKENVGAEIFSLAYQRTEK